MSLFIECVRNFSLKFNDTTYPNVVYFHLLTKIRDAQTPDELGEYLAESLGWKDGKARLDENGSKIITSSGLRYNVSQIKPNTFNNRHAEILKSNDFFDWAIAVRKIDYFDSGLIAVLRDRFNLWDSIVIPAFILHCLRPNIYPIIDKWVLFAFAFFKDNPSYRFSTLENYNLYQSWWLEILEEANLSGLNVQINKLKEIDGGLWSLGKYLSSLNSEHHKDKNLELMDFDDCINSPAENQAIGTASTAFKVLCLKYHNAGLTQRAAIEKAANDLGIDLKPSYKKYPGSHFDRWRRQEL